MLKSNNIFYLQQWYFHNHLPRQKKHISLSNMIWIQLLTGTITGPIQSCPPNSVCSDSSSICDSQSIQPADCPPTCGACSSDKRFACVNATTFAFCFGTQMPSSVMSTCPANQFCDTTVTAPPFCSTNLNVFMK